MFLALDELEKMDLEKIGRELLSTGKGIPTNYGLLFRNENVAFEDVYTTTIAYYIFANVYKVPITSNQYNYAASVGLIFTVLTLPLVFVSRWLLNKVEDVQY